MKKTGVVVAVDILDMEPIPGVVVIHSDIFAQPTFQAIVDATQGKYADVVMSDMAPNVSGDMERDHCEQMALVRTAFAIAQQVLRRGGTFLAKVTQGQDHSEFVAEAKPMFDKTHLLKPPASRSESREFYVCGTGFRRLLPSGVVVDDQ
eukprot:c18665_g1_i2.p2 GENE.c18665_g1_i2~~c18665_g1_i2.p2  ORF type:complete len:149 (+),score=28.68 c18665_g1_i2:301-747(+)